MSWDPFLLPWIVTTTHTLGPIFFFYDASSSRGLLGSYAIEMACKCCLHTLLALHPPSKSFILMEKLSSIRRHGWKRFSKMDGPDLMLLLS